MMGGRGFAEGNVSFFDVWLLTRDSNFDTWSWTLRTTSGSLRRYDHVGFYDPAHKRLLVFGGRSSLGGTPTDSVWALDLKQISISDATLAWSRPTISGTPPTGRAGASMITDPFPRRHTSTSPYFYYGLMFGGQTSSGLSNELWELSVPVDTSDYSVAWRQVTPAGSAVPPARHQHVSVKDSRIIIWGGFGTSSNDDVVWAATIPTGAGNVLSATWQADWQQLPTQAPVTGAAAVNLGRAVFTRESEIFTPSGPSGTWEELDDSALLEDYYPMHFLLPDGYIFSAGERPNSYRMDPSTGVWQPWPPSANQSGHWSGSAVQYRPGKIMKHGTRLKVGTGTTKTIDLTASGGASATWAYPESTIISRVNHNLVLLPSGEVLVTGGTATVIGDTAMMGPRRRPQLWNPDQATWYMTTSTGESLAAEPAIRDYHSTALLLPDGRVLTASGNETPYMFRFAIYCPPYLFRSDGTSRVRPRIANSSPLAKPGDWINVCVDDLNGTPSFCLMRPGSSTHGFDQNQRYVPVSATSVCGYREWRIRIPADVDSVPPGDYMVFCVNDSGVPGVARWLRVDPDFQGTPATCSLCGGGCPYVDVSTAQGWKTENTILGRSLEGELAYDAYRLKLTPDASSGSVTLRLRENEQEITTLDEARLLVVDHTPGLKVMGSDNGVVAGNWTPAWRVTTSRGEDITNLLEGGEGALGWQGNPGDTVLVELDPPQVGLSASAAQDGGGGGTYGGEPKEQEMRHNPDNSGGSARMRSAAVPMLATDADWLRQTGVLIQRPDGEGGWTEAAHWYPREYADESYLPGLGHGITRLIFVGRHRLTSLGRLVPAAGGITVQTLVPASASHSRLGSVGTEVAVGGETTTLAPGDTVTLSFTVPASTEDVEREYVIVTRGVYTTAPSPSRMQPGATGLPQQFALLQNRPNPFGPATTIQFELPLRTRVKLEIFDLLGRRVKTLTNAEWPAGYHRLDWDRRSDAGRFVHAGIYSYRITAGTFRKTRKMVLLAK